VIGRYRHDLRMALRLDPKLPLLWRTPFSVQLGVDSPPVVLNDLTIAEERILAALVIGVSRSGVSMIGTDAGARELDIVRLLGQLEPALCETSPITAQTRTVTLAGSGPTLDQLAVALSGSTIRIRLAGDDPEAAASSADLAITDLAIVVAHYVIPPEFYGVWLRRDIPHLPIVFGDRSVQLGPVIEPGNGPCLYCLQRHRTDADPAWAALASQLLGRRSLAETPLSSGEVAARAARLAISWLDASTSGGRLRGELSTTSVHLDAVSGELSYRRWAPHPACGCGVLPGNEMPGARHPDAIQLPTTIAAGVLSPG
jgi:bacteriocin biosynthesis cyclodehydratase domain-containing protein